MPFLFSPPTVERPVGRDRLWCRFTFDVGTSLIKNDGFYTQVTSPDADDLAAADLFYLGGYEYVVDDDEAEALTEAGYADFLADIPDPEDPGPPPLPDPADYGGGDFGDGDFGR